MQFKFFLFFVVAIVAALFAIPAFAQDPSPIIGLVSGLHPMAPTIMLVVYFIAQVADSYMPESIKSEWPPILRQLWDWLLRNVGESRNALSADTGGEDVPGWATKLLSLVPKDDD